MEFGVHFEDGDYLWLPYSPDISTTTQFETYIRSKSELKMLLYTVIEAKRRVRELNSKPIVLPKSKTFYLNIRFFGETYYDTFQDSVPDAYHIDYVMLANYLDFHNAHHKTVYINVPLIREQIKFTGYFVETFGRLSKLPAGTVLVDKDFAALYPCVIPSPAKPSQRGRSSKP
jgi:hypothetical protein